MSDLFSVINVDLADLAIVTGNYQVGSAPKRLDRSYDLSLVVAVKLGEILSPIHLGY